jgi:hypothetical protein
MIYFVQLDKDPSVIKVGCSYDLHNRLNSLALQYKSDITVMAVYDTSDDNEKYWLRKYRVSEKYYQRYNATEIIELTEELQQEMLGVNDERLLGKLKKQHLDKIKRSKEWLKKNPRNIKKRLFNINYRE